MLLILAAPSKKKGYYKKFQQIVDFQISYAKTILEKQNSDKVVILVDEDTYLSSYQRRVPEENLLITNAKTNIEDIWIRDFATVNPYAPVQFTYSSASMSKKDSRATQQSFNTFVDHYDLEREMSLLTLDGGNIVDNYAGKAITTTRFLDDNNKLSYLESKEKLKNFLNLDELAIIEPDDKEPAIVDPDDKRLAHSDGMVMWLDDNTLLVNDYTNIDPKLDAMVLKELRSSFPTTRIIKVPVKFCDKKQEGIFSAWGININAVMTPENLYIPTFGDLDHQKDFLKIVKENTNKQVLEIDATEVCDMGGSVRCLTWQLAGENAERILAAAAPKKK